MVQKCRHNVKFADVFVPDYLITLVIVWHVKRRFFACTPCFSLQNSFNQYSKCLQEEKPIIIFDENILTAFSTIHER